MNDLHAIMTKIESILWRDGYDTEWDSSTASDIAEDLKGSGYGPSSKPAEPPKRGRKPKAMTFSEAVTRLSKIVVAATKGNRVSAAYQMARIGPSGIQTNPVAFPTGEIYTIDYPIDISRTVLVSLPALAKQLKTSEDPTFELNFMTLKIRDSAMSTTLDCQDDDWGQFPAADFTSSHRWTAETVKLVQHTARVASEDSHRASITRVLIEPDGITATDGHRLERQYCPMGTTQPYTMAQHTIDIMASTRQPVLLALREGKHTYGKGDGYVWARSGLFTVRIPVTTDFPDYRNVIPKTERPHTVTLRKSAIEGLIKRIPKEDLRLAVTLWLEPGKETLATTPILTVPVGFEPSETVTSKIKIGVSPKYLLDLMSMCDDESDLRTIQVVDSFTPIVAKQGEAALHLLMPMRV